MKKYCLNCMREIAEGVFCKECEQRKIPDTLPYQLKPGTVLNGKYLAGKAIKEDEAGITYIGRDLVLDTKIQIKEYFPVGSISRNGGESSRLTFQNEQQKEQFRRGLGQFLEQARNLAKNTSAMGGGKVKDFFEENETAYMILEEGAGKMETRYGREPETRYGREPEMRHGHESETAGNRRTDSTAPVAEPPKKKNRALVPVLLGCAVLLAAAVFVAVFFLRDTEPAVQTEGDYYVTGCKGVLKVRETEDEDSKVLTSLNNGEKVSLVERGGNGSWKVYVEAEEVTGYLDYHYLTNDRDAAMEPISRYVSVGEDEELTILSSSEGDGSSVGILERGDEVTVLALPDKEYAYIYAAEAKAYGYIDRSKLAEEKPAEVKDEEDDDQSGATTSGQTTADLIGPGTPPARDLGVYYVNVQKGYLALRNAKAFDTTNEIGKMYNGDYVYVLRKDGEYWYVYSPFLGSYGYTNANYLVSSYSSVYHYNSSVYYASVASGYLALRNAPSYDAANEIGKIANGQEVDLIDSSLGTYWYVYVPSLDKYGYVNSDYLRK